MNYVKDEHALQNGHDSNETLCTPWQIPEESAQMDGCVDACMTKAPVMVTPDARLGELARRMLAAHVHRVIVVESVTRRPIGVVSTMDILAAVAREASGQTEQHPADDLSGDTIH